MAILEIFGRQVFWQVLRDQTGPDLIIKKTTNQSFHQENICRKFSVEDPFHFDTDPDPRNHFHDYGSGSWFGSKVILTLWFLLNVTKNYFKEQSVEKLVMYIISMDNLDFFIAWFWLVLGATRNRIVWNGSGSGQMKQIHTDPDLQDCLEMFAILVFF